MEATEYIRLAEEKMKNATDPLCHPNDRAILTQQANTYAMLALASTFSSGGPQFSPGWSPFS